jgi:hypothetical protein
MFRTENIVYGVDLEEHLSAYNREHKTASMRANSDEELNCKELGSVSDVARTFKLVADEAQLTVRIGTIYITATPIGIDSPFQTDTMKPRRQQLRDFFASRVTTYTEKCVCARFFLVAHCSVFRAFEDSIKV